MTSKFKIGDKVVLVNADSATISYDLLKDHVYVVQGRGLTPDTIKLEGRFGGWDATRFRLAGVGEIATDARMSAKDSRFERCPDCHNAAGERIDTGLPGGNCASCYNESVLPKAPDANPKTRFGMAKPPIALIPAPALVHMAQAFKDGAAKYGPANWRVDSVSTSTYVNAAMRHIMAWYDGEECDPVSGVHHLGHAAGCLAILMDAQACKTLLDDRPPAAPTGDLIRALTAPIS